MPWQGWGLGLVSVPGGRADFQGMDVGIHEPGFGFAAPRGVFFGVVAGFAEPGTVRKVGFATGAPRNHMVNVPNRRIAVGCAAGIVADFNETPKPAGEEPCFGIGGQEFSRSRRRVEPAKPNIKLLAPGYLGRPR